MNCCPHSAAESVNCSPAEQVLRRPPLACGPARARAGAPSPDAALGCRQHVIFTIGHSTRLLRDFIDLLIAHRIGLLVDVRTVPRSRHNPQFNGDSLPQALESFGVHHVHAAGLGGFRATGPGSRNGAWRNASFRGYADYMQTADFSENLFWLMRLGESLRVALMCAEAVPWRCHRSLIADALLVNGWIAQEILSPTRLQTHKLTPFAKVLGRVITYPPEAPPTSAPQPADHEQ